MLDEPLGALDATLRTGLLDEVPRILRAAGATTVYVTHEQEEALAVADRVAVMRSGRIVQAGRPADLVERPADAFVAGFLRLGALLPVTGRTAAGAVTPLGRLPVRVAGRVEASVILVRPEAVRLSPGPAFVPVRARVVSVHAGAFGARLRLSLEGAGGELSFSPKQALFYVAGYSQKSGHIIHTLQILQLQGRLKNQFHR